MEKTKEELLKEKPDAEEAGAKTKADAAVSKPAEGTKPKTPQTIIDANAAAERLEKATAAQKVENDRREERDVRREMSGKTEAGAPAKKKESEDEKYNREAKERYDGTGLDPTPDDSVTTYG